MSYARFRTWVRDFLSRELRRPYSHAAFGLLLAGCMSHMTPRGKLDDTVQEVNMAARFGRTDIATERVAPSARAAFIKRHKLWGGDVRIVEVEYGGIEKITDSEAIILVGFGWFRPVEGVLRTTVVRQTWKNDQGSGPWYLYDEERANGDVGLLGEQTTVLTPGKKNMQFETTVIK